MTSTEGGSTRDVLFLSIQREMDLALQLADQTQQRAQAVATTLTLVISISAVLVTASPQRFSRLTDWLVSLPLAISFSLLFLSLILSLSVALPKRISLTHPDWVRELFRDGVAYQPVPSEDRSSLVSVQQELDGTFAEAYGTILRSNRLRGNLLLASLLLLGGGVLAAGYVALRISGTL